MVRINDDIAACINSALEDGTPCLLGTVSADGRPEISPKGSMLVLDPETLAFWERSHRGARGNIGANGRVVVYYRNPAHADKLPRGAALRFYGTARIVEQGPERDAVMGKIVQKELDADPERKGAAVIVAVDRVTDLRGQDMA